MNGFWDGAPVISVYTRAQAIDDGVLVDVTEAAREAGFNWPVAITATTFERFVKPSPDLEGLGQSLAGRLWDVLSLLRFAARRGGSVLLYEVAFTMPKPRGGYELQTVQLKAIAGPGDQGEPVLTIMLPEED